MIAIDDAGNLQTAGRLERRHGTGAPPHVNEDRRRAGEVAWVGRSCVEEVSGCVIDDETLAEAVDQHQRLG